jgi:signal peptidase
MRNRYLPVYPSRGRALLLLGAVFFIYFLDNVQGYSNLIKPFLWLALAGLIRVLPRVRSKAPLKLRGNINLWAFNFAVIFIIVSVITGIIDGFGRSPYDHSAIGIIVNIFTVGSMLIGRESARNCIVNNLAEEESFLIFVPISFVMAVISFKIDRFICLKDLKSIVQFTAQYIAPEFLQNLMATYLAFLGGWLPAFIYMGTMQAFHWFSPVLPDAKWITAALTGILCPAFSLPAMQGIFLKDTKALRGADRRKEGLGGWIVTSLVSIAIIWFSVGMFPIYPSVVATGSMKPMIKPGDMILVEKITDKEDVGKLKVGDVIQFKKYSYMVSHRIIEVVEEEGVKLYRTKGDNNSGPDVDLVKPEDLRGRIRFVVPKIGLPTLIIKRDDSVPLEDIEF